MVDNDSGRNIDKDQYGQKQNNSIFDDDLVEDVNSIQEPYPTNEIVDEESSDDEVENPDEKVHEYDDTDHPHEYRTPSAVIDDYQGSGASSGNSFEQQNPLQSTYPATDRDNR
jgi:hypothetical protein